MLKIEKKKKEKSIYSRVQKSIRKKKNSMTERFQKEFMMLMIQGTCKQGKTKRLHKTQKPKLQVGGQHVELLVTGAGNLFLESDLETENSIPEKQIFEARKSLLQILHDLCAFALGKQETQKHLGQTIVPREMQGQQHLTWQGRTR